MDLVKAGMLAIVFTGLLALIEVNWRSHAPLKLACRSHEFVIYLLMLIVGNTATTMAAGAVTLYVAPAEPATDAVVLPEVGGAVWFWYAFIGVFGFEVILQNLNLTVANQGVFTINDWISKARDKAVATAIERQTHADAERAQSLAGRLQGLPEGELNAQLLQALGQERLQSIEQAATASNANVALAKALALAYEAPVEAAAIAEQLDAESAPPFAELPDQPGE